VTSQVIKEHLRKYASGFVLNIYTDCKKNQRDKAMPLKIRGQAVD